ncbi:PepSY domain-containing protein [Marinobacterium sp. D7]|uniref:PepSY domain-containing protein n=1 Tax=Marinobacterium ramblicola TaxID=2849041 RepID=UPI001C2D0045|nr:PepSY domain-containing protein [Marinobacterium ramblicola]MBV1789089.1 PepSY domain-containing protein [Marinobacterium ramblicola]
MVAGTISLGVPSLQAKEKIHQSEARELVKQGEMLSLDDLLAQHGERLAGHLLDVELEREHGRLVYEIEVLGEDGQVREFEIDARSGELLKQKLED